MSPTFLWPCCAGLVFLVAGLGAAGRELVALRGINRWAALGIPFVAASLAVFGAEHLVFGPVMVALVPAWVPFKVFWVYFLGAALLATALSLTVRRAVRLTLLLFAAMMLLFVLTIHLPNVIARPHSRLFWTIMARECVFGAGALALFGAQLRKAGRMNLIVVASRLVIAVVLVFFGVQHCLSPRFAPGVPLEMVTPAWVPMAPVLSVLVGVLLIVCGGKLALNRAPRQAALWVGILMTALTVFLYLPVLIAAPAAAKVEGLNYVFDTLLFGGSLLLLAKALPLVD